MTKGPAVGKSIRFKGPDGYSTWADIIGSDTQNGEHGWIVELEEYNEEDEVIGTTKHFVKDSDILHVEEYPSNGDAELVIYGKVGMPTVTETTHENGVHIMEVDFDSEPEKLGEITICGDPEGLRDLAHFLLEQANLMDGIPPEDRVDGFGHSHYRGCSNQWPDVVVMPILAQDRKSEEDDAAPTIN